jgi:acetyl esterase/lipase
VAAIVAALRHRVRLETVWLLPRHQRIEVHEVEYQSGFLARVYRPRESAPLAAVLDIHGGGWVNGDRFQQELLDRALAANGVLVAAIDYRLAPAHPYPAAVEDVHAASAWLREQHAGPIGAIGSSAGGHLAILCGLRSRNPGLDYVIADAPITDTGSFGNSPFFAHQEDAADANPMRIVTDSTYRSLPPLLITHGSADALVPISVSQQFVSRYREAGGVAELRKFDGLGHAFILTHPRRAEARQQAAAVLAFIRAHGTLAR